MKENKDINTELENQQLKKEQLEKEQLEKENKKIDKKNIIIKIIIIIAIITVVCVIAIKMILSMTPENNKKNKENDMNTYRETSEIKDIEKNASNKENNKKDEENSDKSNQKNSDVNNKYNDESKTNEIKDNKENQTTKPAIKSKWDKYAKQRNGKLGKNVEIKGYWRCLGDIETVWRFNKDKFWWYKSYNNYKDNYWNGSVQILKGKKALNEYRIEYNEIGEKFSLSNDVVSEKNIYAIICKPDKIIINGIDKGKSNIQKGTEWRYLWIIIEHGSEGIEAQVINMDTKEKTYYFKTKDK